MKFKPLKDPTTQTHRRRTTRLLSITMGIAGKSRAAKHMCHLAQKVLEVRGEFFHERRHHQKSFTLRRKALEQ